MMTRKNQRKSAKPPVKVAAPVQVDAVSTRREAPKSVKRLGTAISAYHQEVLAQNEQLKEVQTELEQSHDRYARLYNEAPVGYVLLDRNGVIEKANATTLKLLDMPRHVVVRRPLLIFVHEDDRALFLNFLMSCRSNPDQEKQWAEVRLNRRDGTVVHVQLSSVGVPRDSGNGRVYLTALTDVTGRINSESDRRKSDERIVEVMRQRAAAQAANDAKDRFLAMLSHELRTPLTPVMLRLSAWATDPKIDPEMRDELKIVLDNINLEVRLIDDLLDLSRILRGKFVPDFQDLDLRDVIRHAIQVCEPDILERNLTILPNLYSIPLPVHADRLRLQQVFWNVLRNSVKFTPEGGQITVFAAHADGNVRIHVKDTGIGIESEALPRIFDVFEQGATGITRRFGGLGLGLAISKAIVEAHGGAIEAQSEGKDRGTLITVALPLQAQMPAPKSLPPLRARDAISPSTNKKPLRILLVEDHDDSRKALTKLLTGLGHKLDSVPNAKEATAAASQKHFDLLISDLGLPDVDGYELMRLLHSRYEMKGIALSGFGMPRDLSRSKEAGFTTHMVKPISVDALEKAIDAIFA